MVSLASIFQLLGVSLGTAPGSPRTTAELRPYQGPVSLPTCRTWRIPRSGLTKGWIPTWEDQ